MHIIALKCDQCGAPLDVPADREQLTCTWCGSMLHVSQLQPATATRAVSPAAIEPLQAELDQLDAEWEAYRATYLPKNGTGEYVIPEPEACHMGAWLTGIVGAAAAAFGGFVGNWGLLVLAIVVAGIVIAVLLRQAKIAPVYRRSLENYRHERLAILERLQRSG